MSTRIIQIAIAAALSAAVAGQLPRLVNSVQVAELRLLKDTESSKWGRPFLLPMDRHSAAGRRRSSR